MFILHKIINSPSNTPEYIKLKTAEDQSYDIGAPIAINENGRAINAINGVTPKFICCQKLNGTEQPFVACYKITGDMIFSIKTYDSFQNVSPGQSVDITTDNYERMCLVTNDISSTGKITVFDTCSAKVPGDRILGYFNI